MNNTPFNEEAKNATVSSTPTFAETFLTKLRACQKASDTRLKIKKIHNDETIKTTIEQMSIPDQFPPKDIKEGLHTLFSRFEGMCELNNKQYPEEERPELYKHLLQEHLDNINTLFHKTTASTFNKRSGLNFTLMNGTLLCSALDDKKFKLLRDPREDNSCNTLLPFQQVFYGYPITPLERLKEIQQNFKEILESEEYKKLHPYPANVLKTIINHPSSYKEQLKNLTSKDDYIEDLGYEDPSPVSSDTNLPKYTNRTEELPHNFETALDW